MSPVEQRAPAGSIELYQGAWMTICRSQRGDIHNARARGPLNKCQGSMKRTTEGRKMHSTSGSVWKLRTDCLEEDRGIPFTSQSLPHTLKFYLFAYFGCAGSLLLCAGFLQLWRVGATPRCGAWASSWWPLLGGFSCCGAQALQQEKPPQWKAHATELQSSPGSLQLRAAMKTQYSLK